MAESISKEEKLQRLYRVLVDLRSTEECAALLDDLCTKKEVENMAERIYCAELLLQGRTYQQVIDMTDVSSATLSRVSRCVQYGKGYVRALKKEE